MSYTCRGELSEGRFEIAGLPRGLVRLRLEPHDPARPAFATAGFEI